MTVSMQKARRMIIACAVIAMLIPLAVVLKGIAVEAPVLWRNGAESFVADAGARIAVGTAVALLHLVPYFLVARAMRLTGPPAAYASAAAVMLAFQVFVTVRILFFERSSTAALGLMFMPAYLLCMAAAVWIVAFVTRGLGAKRG